MKIKLSFDQLNIASLLVNVIGASITGFGTGFTAGAGTALASGLSLQKSLLAGCAAGGAAALASIGTNVAGFFSQRTKGPDGTAPLFPSIYSTNSATAILGAQAGDEDEQSAALTPPVAVVPGVVVSPAAKIDLTGISSDAVDALTAALELVKQEQDAREHAKFAEALKKQTDLEAARAEVARLEAEAGGK